MVLELAAPADVPDTVLVERARAGDAQAFRFLVLKYQRRIQRLIGRMVHESDWVEDVAQETFIRAHKALHQFRGDAQFYTWLYRIAVNTAKRFLLERKRAAAVSVHRQPEDDAAETFWPEGEPSTNETPESQLAAREIAAMVNAAVDALAPELREAIVLREIEGLSYDEIAVAMQCPVGTVRSRIFRAREAISSRIRPLLEHQTGKRW